MKKQISESLIIACLMAVVGGIFDAYSYYLRGHTFATMQTGNMILLGLNLIEGNVSKALMYLIPIFAFFLGGFFSQIIENKLEKTKKIIWQQFILLIEIILVIPVIFIPNGNLNWLANMFISLASGMQLHTFRKAKGLVIATTMCTGNLKSAGTSLGNAFSFKDKKYLLHMLMYLAIILSFFIGVVTSFALTKNVSIYAISLALIPLIISFSILFIKKEVK